MSSINQQCIKNNHRYIVHQNLRGNLSGRNPKIISYMSKITFIGRTNFQIIQHQLEGGSNPLFIGSNPKEGKTPSILQLQLEGGSNPLVYRLQPKGSSNSLSSLAPTGRRIQPPFLSLSYHPKI
jgi:hypothetical protein